MITATIEAMATDEYMNNSDELTFDYLRLSILAAREVLDIRSTEAFSTSHSSILKTEDSA